MQQNTNSMPHTDQRYYLKEQKVLIIEDDLDTLFLLSQIFLRAGGDIITAEKGDSGLQKVIDYTPDLVILDIMMPDMDGYEVCTRIRKKSSVPIIMLTALDQETDVIHGLDAGANDFLSKPISRSLLLSRSQAALRSSLRFHISEKDTIDYSDGYLTIMLAQQRVWVCGKPVRLTLKEFDLLDYLFKNAGYSMTSDEILTYAWGWDERDCIEDVYTVFTSLRTKIELDLKTPTYLTGEAGKGYSFLSPSLTWQPGMQHIR